MDGHRSRYRHSPTVPSGGEGIAPLAVVFPGEGGIVSTVDDMHRFANALGSERLLSTEMWEIAYTPHGLPEDAHRPHPAHRNPYGYGFSMAEGTLSIGRSARVAEHGGMSYGGSATLQRFVDHDRVLILWNNVGGSHRTFGNSFRFPRRKRPSC